MRAFMADRKLQEMVARLATAGYGVVMVAPGYSRGELIADLLATRAALGDERRGDERGTGDRSGP